MPFRHTPYKYLVALAFLFGIFMDLMDLTIVNVALPTLGRDFGAGSSTLEWVVTGYLLSLAIWIPASGWIGDRFGTKRTFMFALLAFTLGSALCGARAEHRAADRIPRLPGRRRRHDDAGRHRDAVPRVPAPRAGARVAHPHDPHRDRPRDRADPGRLAR